MFSRRRFLITTGWLGFAPLVWGAARDPRHRLGLVADCQYADLAPLGTRYYRNSVEKLTEAVDHFNRLDLDACVNLGDLVNGGWSSFDPILDVFHRCRHRVHHGLGNHDFELPDEFKPRVPGRLGLNRRYYTLRFGEFCLVMLDTNDVSLYAHPARSGETRAARVMFEALTAARALNAQSWNGAVGAPQLRWLGRTCATAARAGRKVILFSHHPVFPASAHSAWNAEGLLRVIESHRNIVAWFSGHNHQGQSGVYDGVPCLTLKGMVETAKENAFSVLHLRADRLELIGYGREVSRELLLRKG